MRKAYLYFWRIFFQPVYSIHSLSLGIFKVGSLVRSGLEERKETRDRREGDRQIDTSVHIDYEFICKSLFSRHLKVATDMDFFNECLKKNRGYPICMAIVKQRGQFEC
jgi:hypothetical protein